MPDARVHGSQGARARRRRLRLARDKQRREQAARTAQEVRIERAVEIVEQSPQAASSFFCPLQQFL